MELRDRLQPLLTNHVDSCLADIPGMPKDIAGLIVEHLHLPYDVANFKNLSQDDMNKFVDQPCTREHIYIGNDVQGCCNIF